MPEDEVKPDDNLVVGNELGTQEYSIEEIEELEKLIQQQVIPHEASNRVASAPENGKFVVYGHSSSGVIVADDGSGVQDVVDRVALGYFPSKTEAENFLSLSESIVQSGESALDWWEGLTSVSMDTYSASSIEELNSDLSNSTLLQNLLTSNSPTINIPMLMDELCKVIVPMAEDFIDGKKTEIELFNLQKAIDKAKKALIRRLVSLAYQTACNASQKLRRMAASRIRGILAEYVADECIQELGNALDDLENPDNLLSAEEFGSTMADIFNGAVNPFGQIVNSVTSNAIAGWKNVIEIYSGLTDPNTKLRQMKSVQMAVACATEFACARSKTFADSKLSEMAGSISDSIKKTMQGCLFQQALQTTKQFAPDSLPADIMNRVSNLAQNGELMDAYNVALAAGVDLQGAPFRVQLPSASKWVSEIYGDPYLFSPEKPSNAQQVADYIVGSLPSAEQLMTGTVTEEQMLDRAVAENWTLKDQSYAALQSTLNDQNEYRQQVINGTSNTGKTVSYAGGSIDANGNVTVEWNEDGTMKTVENVAPMVKPKV